MIEDKIQSVNLAVIIDHSGRGGNAFFLTIFDQHPEILSCPLMHYTYSYIITEFGDNESIEIETAKKFLTQKSYFRLLYNEPLGDIKQLIYRMGLNPDLLIDRAKIREVFDDFCQQRQFLTRSELVLLPFLVYAKAMGRDLAKIKYVLVSDAISLRFENVNNFFSGRVVDSVLTDFPNAKLVDIGRDPRATFASPRHQFVNSLGNMYALKWGNFYSRLTTLIKRQLQPDNGCVYLYWLMYLAQAYKTICVKKEQYSKSFLTIKNEDLNLNFQTSIKSVVDWFEVSYLENWNNNPFQPTIIGYPWNGTGAYNSRYQQYLFGPLENDPKSIVEKSVGPNAHVTERWKQRLNSREIELIERLFSREMEDFNYQSLKDNKKRSDWHCLLRSALLPFQGELPKWKWIKDGVKVSSRDLFDRLFYTVCFIPFYVTSRVILFNLVMNKKFFKK